jgi:two-component system nitrogen regulation response regulator NtrX
MRVQELVRRAASVDLGVLLTAEPGIDVKSIAREIHARSRRAAAPFIAAESDGADASRVAQILFGATTPDAPSDLESVERDSRIAEARGGTIFLQDVAEIPAAVQARLARVARDGEVLIDGEPVPTELRFIASASPGVDADVHAHRLRSDLFRRLAAVRIDLPPLRQRQEDVPAIAVRLLEDVLAEKGRAPRAFTHAALGLIAAVSWSGNLAELEAAIARVAGGSDDHDIQVEHLLSVLHLQRAPARFVPTGNLREARQRFERDYISAVLQHHNWRVADAAHTLGIQRPNLYRKARQLGIPVTRIAD